MKNICPILIFLLLGSFVFSQQNEVPLIPRPKEMVMKSGEFKISSSTKIIADKEFEEVADLLREYPIIKESLSKNKAFVKNTIQIMKSPSKEKGYKLSISPEKIQISASDKVSVINAVYTLIQTSYLQKNHSVLPSLEISDAPEFSYRGLHMDVSRHFMPLSFVKKFIDVMALYKFNQFHWHLTDGPGWRLEIKKYPELTNIASWRNFASWSKWWENGRQYVEKGNPNAYGGFYTQEEARELVKYAEKRGINVIPEIEMPGHSEEVLAVYPQLSCTGKPYTSSEFCIGNTETFVFLKNVLDEVIAIFPSKYIHIGGDEADRSHWKNCPKCQGLMKKLGLKDEAELQSYLIKEMDKYVTSKGRKIIGWDEILEGGLSEGATVMSWRGEEGGIKSANMGHDVIMTPGKYLYLDMYQAEPYNEPPAMGGFVPIETVYSYNPVPKEIAEDKRHHILGAQGNLWAEIIPTTNQMEYMAFPRALAVSEINWTPEKNKNFENFRKRLQSHYYILQDLQVNYHRPSYEVQSKIDYDKIKNTFAVTLFSEQINPEIRYTTDSTEPNSNSPIYTKFLVFSNSVIIKSASFLNGKKVSSVKETFVDAHKALNKKVIYNLPWEKYPAQKEATLTNGIMGGNSYGDGEWQGFIGKGMDVVIDMETPQTFNKIIVHAMQQPNPGIYFPGEIKVSISDDGKNFTDAGKLTIQENTKDNTPKLKRFEVPTPNSKAKFIKITADNPMNGFIFFDEVMVY